MHTGSWLPFQIRVASVWLSVFRACIVAPRGGPRSEPSRPDGFRPTSSSSFIRRNRSFFFLSSHSPSPRAQSSSPSASSLLPFVARALPPGEPPSLLRRTSPNFAARRILAVLPSKSHHWCFAKLFFASPSPDFLSNC